MNLRKVKTLLRDTTEGLKWAFSTGLSSSIAWLLPQGLWHWRWKSTLGVIREESGGSLEWLGRKFPVSIVLDLPKAVTTPRMWKKGFGCLFVVFMNISALNPSYVNIAMGWNISLFKFRDRYVYLIHLWNLCFGHPPSWCFSQKNASVTL